MARVENPKVHVLQTAKPLKGTTYGHGLVIEIAPDQWYVKVGFDENWVVEFTPVKQNCLKTPKQVAYVIQELIPKDRWDSLSQVLIESWSIGRS